MFPVIKKRFKLMFSAYPHRELIGQIIKLPKEVGNMDDITIYVRKEAKTIGVGHL